MRRMSGFMIVHDHVVTDLMCNLRCTYCPCDVDVIKRRQNLLIVRSSRYGPAYQEPITAFVQRNGEVIRRSKSRRDSAILKLSGGEIFLVPEFMELLPDLSKQYALVQILTNGTLINREVIERLRHISNIQVQVSLDGHRIEMNIYRFRDPRILGSILTNLTALSEAEIPLEINCVLTAANTEGFFGFARDLDERVRVCTIYPFPVRSHPELFPGPEQIETFEEEFKTSLSSVKHLLPPVQYFYALIEFMKSGKRNRGCYIPYTVLATSGEGELVVCTCGPVKTLGNVLAANPDEAFEKVGEDECYKILTEPDISPPCCRDCFTHYDIINLFIEGRISIEELKAMPFFAAPEVSERLVAIKRERGLGSQSEVGG